MPIKFDGRKIRDEILSQLRDRISRLKTKPTLAVIWVGENPVSEKYIRSKQRAAKEIGVNFKLYQFSALASEADIVNKIKELNKDKNIIGILLQMPLPNKIDRQKVIKAISAKKDIDGLRFCAGFESDFQPPVVLAILEALNGVDFGQNKVAIVGRGFLVGTPLARVLLNKIKRLKVADIETADLAKITRNADIIISATGQAGLITVEMVKNGVVLVDAGTAEISGKLRGDIDQGACKKSSFYTPVPCGIGPVTLAMLYKNLIQLAEKSDK